jgi:hypothetical protein
MATFSVNHTGGLPAWIWTPLTGVNVPSQGLKITSTGNNPAYIGPAANLQTPNALPVALAPGQRVFLNGITQATYVCGNYSPGTVTAALAAAISTAGSTLFTVASAPASFPAGTSFLVGNAASSRELLVVASTSASSVITSTTGSLYDHAVSSTISTVVFSPVQVLISNGVL